MRPVYFAMALFFVTQPTLAAKVVCKSEADTFKWIQEVNAGMMLSIGKMNPTIMQDIGSQLKAGQALSQQGKYQQACDTYLAIMTKYKFKTMQEAYYEKNPGKRPGAKPKAASGTSQSSGAAIGVASDSATDTAGEKK